MSYRNVCYKINQNWEGEIYLYTWDEEGRPVEKLIPHRSHLYYEDPKGTYMSMFNTKLKKKYFKSVIDRSRWIKERPATKIYESLPPEREFLLETFEGQQEKPEFRKLPLRIHYLDIEVAIEDVFPEPSLAEYPINVTTVYDSYLETYFVWVLKDDRWCEKDLYFDKAFLEKTLKVEGRKGEIPKTEFFLFDDESEMLHHYLKWFRSNRPDAITGWNIEDFDIPYLVNRMKLFVDEDINHLSPIGEVRKIVRDQRGASKALSTYKIAGVAILDYLLLYKHKFFIGSKPSWKLENIAQEDLGYGKLSYEGTMKQFYRNEFKKFVAYNIIDVMLTVDLDHKHKYIELARTICNMGLCEYEAIFRSSPYIVGALALQAHTMDKIIITDDRVDYQNTSFTGAYVFPVIPSIYTKGICSLDLNSLYPNIIINCNISPETKIGKVVDDDGKSKTFKFKNDALTKKLSYEQIDQLYGKVTISANGIVYINPEKQKGIIPAFLERLYEQRKSIKAQGKRLEKGIVKLEERIEEIKEEYRTNPSEELKEELRGIIKKIKIDKAEAELKDQIQGAFKVYLNSVYGQLGNRYFAMFDIDNAEAVTISGQRIIKSSAEFVNNHINEKYGTDRDWLAGGDTDSLYFNIEPITEEVIGQKTRKWSKADVHKLCKHLDDNFVPLVNEHCANVTRNQFLSPYTNIEFKREKLCERLAYYAKKRYIAMVRDDEGVYIPSDSKKKWKCTGVDIKKNELPAKIKGVLEFITFTAIQDDWTSQKYMNELTDVWNTFIEIPPDDMAFIKGYNTEKNSDGFLQTEKGAGAHAKAAIYYNHIIQDLGLQDKYNEIRLGNDIRFVYVTKGNKYGVNVIGWEDEWPEEFDDIFEIDYEVMFEKVVMAPLKRLVEICDWSQRHPADEIVFDIFNL